MRKLTLAKETLRILDDHALSLVAGGGDSSENSKHNNGHGKTGKNSDCNAHGDKHASKKSSCNSSSEG